MKWNDIKCGKLRYIFEEFIHSTPHWSARHTDWSPDSYPMWIPVPPRIRWDPSALRGQKTCSRAVASVALSAVPLGRPYPALTPRRWVAHRSSLQSRVIRPAAWTNVDETLARRRSTDSRTSRAPTSKWLSTAQSAWSFSLPAVHLQQSMAWTADSWFFGPCRSRSRSRNRCLLICCLDYHREVPHLVFNLLEYIYLLNLL